MRNLKKLLALLVVVMMLATTMMTAFAADTTTTVAAKTDAEIVTALGVLQGGSDGVTADYLALGTQRVQAAIMYLRLLGLEDEARAFDGTANFADASKVSGTAKNVLAYLKANKDLGWQGDGTNFNPTEAATPQMLYKVMLVGLGYKEGTDFDYMTETMGYAKALGLDAIATKTTVTNADFATAIVEALKTNVKGSTTQTLVAKLVADKIVSAEQIAKVATELGYTAPVVTPVVADFTLSATNLKEVVVTFSKAIDPTLLVKANFTASTTGSVDSLVVGSDNKTVTLLLTTAMTTGANTVDITVAKAVLGAAADVKKTLSAVVDGTLPTIVGAVADGNSGIIVTFSEPIKTVGTTADYKLNNLYFAQSALPTVAGRTLTIKPTTRMAAGENTITLPATITDYAGYAITGSRDIKFTVDTDAVAPTVSFVSATQTSIKVKFSEPVAAFTAGATFTNGATAGTYTPDADKMTYTITNTGTAFPVTGTTTITFAKANIADLFGNSPTADLTLTFTAVADVARPEVKSVAVATDNQNKIIVTFSKAVPVTTAGVNFAGTYTLTETKSDGTNGGTVTLAALAYNKDADNKDITTQVVLAPNTGSFNPTSTYSLSIYGVSDLDNPLSNKITPYLVTGLKVLDKTAPAFASMILNGQSIYITFDDVLAATATTATNFQYIKADNTVVSSLPSGVTAELINSSKTIKLTWPVYNASTAPNGLNPSTLVQLQYVGLKGTDGNDVTAKVVLQGAISGTGGTPTLSAAKVTGTKTVVVTLTNAANLVFDPANAMTQFEVRNGDGTKLNFTNATFAVNATVATSADITFTTYESFTDAGVISGLGYSVYTIATPTITNFLGVAVAANPTAGTPVLDKIAPSADTLASTDNNTLTLTFSEKLGLADGAYANAAGEFRVLKNGVLTAATYSYAAATGILTIDTGATTFAAADVFTLSFDPISTSGVVDVATTNILKAFVKTKTY